MTHSEPKLLKATVIMTQQKSSSAHLNSTQRARTAEPASRFGEQASFSGLALLVCSILPFHVAAHFGGAHLAIRRAWLRHRSLLVGAQDVVSGMGSKVRAFHAHGKSPQPLGHVLAFGLFGCIHKVLDSVQDVVLGVRSQQCSPKANCHELVAKVGEAAVFSALCMPKVDLQTRYISIKLDVPLPAREESR